MQANEIFSDKTYEVKDHKNQTKIIKVEEFGLNDNDVTTIYAYGDSCTYFIENFIREVVQEKSIAEKQSELIGRLVDTIESLLEKIEDVTHEEVITLNNKRRQTARELITQIKDGSWLLNKNATS